MKRFSVFLIILAAGWLVFFVGGYWAGMPVWSRSLVKIAIPCALLATAAILKSRGASARWRKLAVAFLAASAGFLLSWLLAGRIATILSVEPTSVPGIAITKLIESALIVIAALLTARLGGLTASDLYLSRGRARTWLAVGLASFTACAVLSTFQSFGQGISPGQLLAWAPWTLLFVFSNAFMEELHFRGLLLRPAESFLGKHGANICIAVFFTLVHAPVSYTPDIVPFLLVLFALSVVWGFVIQRTESLWGAVLFHAGADLLVMVGIYQAYGAIA
jgi:membrane protease YdiL (CAAX protease family)